MFDGWYSANLLIAAMFLARAQNMTAEQGFVA
jgi:hypothetical protein